MNAPRQGLYATLLVISFALHAALMIQGADHEAFVSRQAQGELLTKQLIEDAVTDVSTQDRVALALLVNRYGARPDVASLQVLNLQKEVLASGGQALTREGQVFERPILLDQRPIGAVRLSLIVPSRGELIRRYWLPLVLSGLIHGLLWLFYRVAAKPRESVEQKTEPAVEAAHGSVELPSDVVALAENIVESEQWHAPVSIQFAFDDPRQLLDTLSPSLAEPYFLLCQTLLEQALVALQKTDLPTVEAKILDRFDTRGAHVGLRGAKPSVLAQHAVLLASLFNLLSEVVYRRHRESKHFALHTKAVVMGVEQDAPPVVDAAVLFGHAKANGVVVHVSDEMMTQLMRSNAFRALEHPMDRISREAMQLDGLGAEHAQLVGQLRAKILGNKPKAEETTS